jgi:putative transposase
MPLARDCAFEVYRLPRPANDDDLGLMRWHDELFTARPFLGSRRMAAMPKAEGLLVNRKRVQRLMRRMGIAALGPKPCTTKPAPGDKIYPYLLRDMATRDGDRAPQPGVGCRYHFYSDRARLPLSGGEHRLGKPGVPAWRLSNTMDTSFWLAALEDALARYGRPPIFNTGQGSQFTSAAFTGASRSPWMAAAAGWATSSSSAYGVP